MPGSDEFLVMAKPVGPRCNLRCEYCYYLVKAETLARKPYILPQRLLEEYIRQRISGARSEIIHFEWHGGEPTLAGPDYFRTIAGLQRVYAKPGKGISNGIQTNGLLINGEWASFFRQAGFSVGLSLDGPASLHDAFRRTAAGEPSHEQVVRAFHVLRRHRVFVNILCVLSAANAAEPDAVYDFFRELGATHLQFLPLVERTGTAISERTASPEALGGFLCRVFDRWIREDVGRVVVQTFDEALRPLYGVPHALCIHRPVCGDVLVLERDGSVYACDHFVDAEHRLGSIEEHPLAVLAADPRLRRFGLDKRNTLPGVCLDCDVLEFCNGGCPKDRFMPAPDGSRTLNYLCPAYKRFFRHAREELTRLAAHMKAGKRLTEFRGMG
jgi:uncharacterized protein